MKGYAGKGLLVDLTGQTVTKVDIDKDLIQEYIGGRALGAKMLFDILPANTGALDPANPIILLTGPITGTITPGSCKLAVVTKSPATGGYLDAYTSGMVAPELKYAGYDWLVITGASSNPCILLVRDDEVSIVSGDHLWGKDAFKAEDELIVEYGHDCGRLVIGPAGENLVVFACVNSDYFRQLGRGGLGAVMGSKKLKAIVVKGSGQIEYNDLDAMLETSEKALKLAKSSSVVQTRINHGTPMTLNITNNSGTLPTRNFQKGTFNDALGQYDGEGTYKASAGTRACLGCLSPCGKIVKVERADYYLEGPEYETVGLLGSNLEISSMQEVAEANLLCDRLGLDTISTGGAIGFAMECNEKGLLSEYHTDIKFGSFSGILDLIEDIAYRRGLGNILADGVRAAADRIGGGSNHFAMHVRGLELAAYDPRGSVGNALSYTVTARGGCHRRSWPPSEIFAGLDPFSYKNKAAFVKQNFDNQCVLHSLVSCDFHSSGLPFPVNEFAIYIKQITGRSISEEELKTIAERAETLIRMLNIREGSIPKLETLPDRFFEDPIPDGPASGNTIDKESYREMLEEYYELRGWDNFGKPTLETAEKLGLADEWRRCFS